MAVLPPLVEAGNCIAFVPSARLLAPVTTDASASDPIATFEDPVVTNCSAFIPIAVFDAPVVRALMVPEPTAVLFVPDVSTSIELSPTATLPVPVVLDTVDAGPRIARQPTATLPEWVNSCVENCASKPTATARLTPADWNMDDVPMATFSFALEATVPSALYIAFLPTATLRLPPLDAYAVAPIVPVSAYIARWPTATLSSAVFRFLSTSKPTPVFAHASLIPSAGSVGKNGMLPRMNVESDSVAPEGDALLYTYGG